MTVILQVAKFLFEEVPANKQGAKPEPCPASANLISAPGSALVLDIETKTGLLFDYNFCFPASGNLCFVSQCVNSIKNQ